MLKLFEWELSHKDRENDTLLEKNVFPCLTGLVFHMTDQRGYEGIIKSGFIENNRDNKFPYSFSVSENSFGRKRGHICLFDFREKTNFEIRETLEKLYFLPAHQNNYTLYYFILKQKSYSGLIPVSEAWTGERYVD
ncbi:MAG: hypothetical protein PF482_03790 [Desulfobacteraceae bacterium]|jgi:hypothetical protein|nr:hypothetical protein [Desulfobacteraceae bacterium]